MAQIGRKMREDKIRGAVIFGENLSAAPNYHAFTKNLEFPVVADQFLTETAPAADVFLPLSAYWETEGHFRNWAGMLQEASPISRLRCDASLKNASPVERVGQRHIPDG